MRLYLSVTVSKEEDQRLNVLLRAHTVFTVIEHADSYHIQNYRASMLPRYRRQSASEQFSRHEPGRQKWGEHSIRTPLCRRRFVAKRELLIWHRTIVVILLKVCCNSSASAPKCSSGPFPIPLCQNCLANQNSRTENSLHCYAFQQISRLCEHIYQTTYIPHLDKPVIVRIVGQHFWPSALVSHIRPF